MTTSSSIDQFDRPNVAIGPRLDALVERRVSVTWTTIQFIRAGFHTAISVSGDLERNGQGHYRVLVNDGSYAYFSTAHVARLTCWPDGETSKNGAVAAIFIESGAVAR